MGSLRVRGASAGSDVVCTAGHACSMTLSGDVAGFSKVLFIPDKADITCGDQGSCRPPEPPESAIEGGRNSMCGTVP